MVGRRFVSDGFGHVACNDPYLGSMIFLMLLSLMAKSSSKKVSKKNVKYEIWNIGNHYHIKYNEILLKYYSNTSKWKQRKVRLLRMQDYTFVFKTDVPSDTQMYPALLKFVMSRISKFWSLSRLSTVVRYYGPLDGMQGNWFRTCDCVSISGDPEMAWIGQFGSWSSFRDRLMDLTDYINK